MSRRPARCTQAEIRRAVEAAKQAGGDMIVEIAADGTIRLIPVPASQRQNPSTGRRIVL